MSKELHIYYDEEGDFLEIETKPFTRTYCRYIGEDIFERIDEKTGETKGIGIFSFKKRTKNCKPIDIKLPFDIKSARPQRHILKKPREAVAKAYKIVK